MKLPLWGAVQRWLTWILPRHTSSEIIGDLLEETNADAEQRGRLRASLRLLREAIDLTLNRTRTRHAPPPVVDVHRMRWSLLVRELRFAARRLRRAPVFLLVASITLAVGIGASTAVFTLIDRTLLSPLPYPNAARLALIAETRRTSEISVAYPNFLDWQNRSRSFDALALFEGTSFTLHGRDGAERIRAQYVSANLFHVLGTAPLAGRALSSDDERDGAQPVAVIGYALWRRVFGGDPLVTSKTIDLDGRAHTIVGVMPDGFDFPGGIVYGPAEVYVPISDFIAANRSDIANRRAHPGLEAIGLLKPGETLAAGRSDLTSIEANLESAYPSTNREIGVLVQDGVTALVGDLRGQLTAVAAAVGLLLLIACANVAGLTLTRATSRMRELAVDAALGAPRWYVIASPLCESLIVAAAGGIIGAGVAAALLRTIAPYLVDLPRLGTIAFNWRAFAGCAALTTASAIVCGLAPAMALRRSSLDPLLRQRGGSHAARGRSALVVAQLALALVLLLGAGVLAATLRHLASDRGGIVPNDLMTFDIRLPNDAAPERAAQFFSSLEDRLRASPAIAACGATNVLPFSGSGSQSDFGRPGDAPEQFVRTDVAVVTTDYFRTMGIPVVRGRAFTAADSAGRPPVAIIDTRLAARLFPSGDAVGRRIQGRGDLEIVGIVGHVANYGVASPSREELYVPAAQGPRTRLFVIARGPLPSGVVSAVRDAVAAIDPLVPVANIRPMTTLMDGMVAGTRLSSIVGISFAGAAVTLAVVGLTGLVAYLVQLKRREIGIRLALGAGRGQVVAQLLIGVARLLAIGAAIGICGGLAGVRLLQTAVAGTEPIHPALFVALPVALSVVALAASWLPAQVAARVPPTIALRDE